MSSANIFQAFSAFCFSHWLFFPIVVWALCIWLSGFKSVLDINSPVPFPPVWDCHQRGCPANGCTLGWGGGGGVILMGNRPWDQCGDSSPVLASGLETCQMESPTCRCLTFSWRKSGLLFPSFFCLEPLRQLRSNIGGPVSVLLHQCSCPVCPDPSEFCAHVKEVGDASSDFILVCHWPFNCLVSVDWPHIYLSKEVRSFYKHFHSNFLHVFSD